MRLVTWGSPRLKRLTIIKTIFKLKFIHQPWSWVKLQERVLESIIQLHDGGLVAASVAVVGSGEDGDHVPVVGPVVSLHHQLVGPRYQGQPVRMVECLGNVLNIQVLEAV